MSSRAACFRASAAAILAALLTLAGTPANAAEWPVQVTAAYRITFNGFEIGTFQFTSTMGPSGYVLAGDAELSALLGVFTWRGATRSSGTVAGEAPKPIAYTFDFSSNTKAGSVKMAFNGGGVANISSVPPDAPQPDIVPVRDQHLKDVLDPLSAVMALTRGAPVNPCGRKISIFDGKQRFDLLLSLRGQQPIEEATPSGQPGIAYICQVKYVPIAGYRKGEETRQMADNSGIEVALRPIPSANLLIPYQITVPTIAGSAVLQSQRVEITMSDQRRIALAH